MEPKGHQNTSGISKIDPELAKSIRRGERGGRRDGGGGRKEPHKIPKCQEENSKASGQNPKGPQRIYKIERMVTDGKRRATYNLPVYKNDIR